MNKHLTAALIWSIVGWTGFIYLMQKEIVNFYHDKEVITFEQEY